MVRTKQKSNANQVVEELIAGSTALGLDLDTLEIVLAVESVRGDFVEFKGRIIINPHLASGHAVADEIVKEIGRPIGQVPVPNWNGKELWFDDRAVKRFRRPARNQQTVLAVFQEEDWPERIDNPIPANEYCDAQSRLQDTIKSLNRNHIQDPSPIKFRGDGTGTGVVWERTQK